MYSRIVAALLCLAFAAPLALAQETVEPCADSESIQGCYERILQAMTPVAAMPLQRRHSCRPAWTKS